MDEVLDDASNPSHGKYLGRVKWFQDKKGHGFIIVMTPEEEAGREVFVHFSGIRPVTSLFKTLRKNEYVNFNLGQGKQGLQAVDVTGVMGGPLICDAAPPLVLRPPQAPEAPEAAMSAFSRGPPPHPLSVFGFGPRPPPPPPRPLPTVPTSSIFSSHVPGSSARRIVPPPPPPPPPPAPPRLLDPIDDID